MSDLIKREDAIKAVAQDLMYESCIQSEYASDELSDWIEVAKVMLEEVSSAERPQGYWIKTDVATYRCSECGKIQIADDVNELNFCCCCGSRNKVRRKGASNGEDIQSADE